MHPLLCGACLQLLQLRVWFAAHPLLHAGTVHAARRQDLPANATGCARLQVYVNTHTQSGVLRVDYAFDGWVGIKHRNPV